MTRRAVIYVRTSSETQGESSSPFEQEADCLHLAQEKELQVVRVYRDVEKYQVGNKLVEPSGSRSDRPGLQAMLKNAPRDEFDVILAWRRQIVPWTEIHADGLGNYPGLYDRSPIGKGRF